MSTEIAGVVSEPLDQATPSTETPRDPGTSTASPPPSDSSSTIGPWKPTGRCFYCLGLLETDQRAPSEETTRHIESKVPYLDCEPAQRMPTAISRSGDICPMGKVDLGKVAKLQHYGIDPREIRHWRYVKHTTGAGHRVFAPKLPGEE